VPPLASIDNSYRRLLPDEWLHCGGNAAGFAAFDDWNFLAAKEISTMNRRDQQLLDKQLWGVNPHPPGNGGILGFLAVAVFCAGVAIGGLLATPAAKQPQTSWRAAAAIVSPNGAPPARLR
jgi:hypothetical protein